jgi:hypothetical protein
MYFIISPAASGIACASCRRRPLPHLQRLRVALLYLKDARRTGVSFEGDVHPVRTFHPPMSAGRLSSIGGADHPVDEAPVRPEFHLPAAAGARESVLGRPVDTHVTFVFLERVNPSTEDLVRQLVQSRSNTGLGSGKMGEACVMVSPITTNTVTGTQKSVMTPPMYS